MEISKIKNLIILVLILINVFFLIIVISGYISDSAEKKQILLDMQSVLARNDIEIDIDNISEKNDIVPYRTERNDGSETAIAFLLLGETNMEDQGSNIHTYTGESGTATFRSSGDFEIEIYDGLINVDNSSSSMVKRLLKEMGVETSDLVVDGDIGNEIITSTCTCSGTSVFNCRISFVFVDGLLAQISGRLFEDVLEDSISGEMITAATALQKFMTYVDNEEFECSEVKSVEAGYFMSVVLPDEGELTPTWLITTDNGDFYVNGLTGDVVKSVY